MVHIKSVFKFVIGFSILYLVTYFFAGIIAQKILGASEFYPPSILCIKLLERSFEQSCSDAIYASTIRQGHTFCRCHLTLQKEDFWTRSAMGRAFHN